MKVTQFPYFFQLLQQLPDGVVACDSDIESQKLIFEKFERLPGTGAEFRLTIPRT